MKCCPKQLEKNAVRFSTGLPILNLLQKSLNLLLQVSIILQKITLFIDTITIYIPLSHGSNGDSWEDGACGMVQEYAGFTDSTHDQRHWVSNFVQRAVTLISTKPT